MKDRPRLQSHPRVLKMSKGQRKSLPVFQDPREDYSIWDIIKPNLGKVTDRFDPLEIGGNLGLFEIRGARLAE